MSSIKSLLDEAKSKLAFCSESPAIDAVYLLGFVLQCQKSYLIAHEEDEVSPEHQAAFDAVIQRRRQGEPCAYITQQQSFWSMTLKVTPDTLIPRPETEFLVEAVLGCHPDSRACQIADLGTGSGAIALAIATERPSWRVHATDVSDAALNVAKQNAVMLGLEQICFFSGNWCRALPEKNYDVIISNPPYVAEGDPHLSSQVQAFEPRLALFAEEHGYAAFTTIIEQAKDYLVPGGYLLFEHGFLQQPQLVQMLESAGYQAIQGIKDLQGLPRLVVARFARGVDV